MSSIRQLAAIMFTDIVGYTALMGKDEQAAFDILRKNRGLQKPLIEQHGGTWIKELGDGVLASFSTVSDAVQAAIKIQEVCHKSEEFLLRIGIHQGEVVVEGNDIFGDAVNIASRIQSLAPAGGIWVSETVHQNVSNKQGISTRFVKQETLKNVKELVRIYEVDIGQETTPSPAIIKDGNKNTVEKSIAVLPFINMSSDPEQEYFSDGLTEEIITDLSRLGTLLVISRNSMMSFKGTQKKTKEIAGEVNARYVLEGSVRKAGNNLRITTQLIDSMNDGHVWAEKYSGTIDDIFEIQENVSRSIAQALNLKLTKEEDSQLSQHQIQDAKAHECYIRARQEIWKFTEQGLDNAITLAQQGLDMVGENGALYATLSMAHLFIQHYGIRRNPSYLENAYRYAAKTLELDADSLPALFVQGTLSFKKGNLQAAANTYKSILSKDQNFPEALQFLTVCCFLSGKPEAGWPYTKRLLQVDPLTKLHHGFPGFIELFNGNFEASLPYHQKLLQIDPNSPFTRYWCAMDFALCGKLEDSISVLDAMARDTPNMIFGKFALFLKSALGGDTESALKHATNELREEAALLDFMPLFMAYGYALIDKADEALWWLNKTLDFGYSPYPLLLKWETFQHLLKDHPAFQAYLQEIKKRSEQFDI